MRRLTLVLVLSAAWLAGCGGPSDQLLLLDELPQVESVTIEGNEVFDDNTLKNFMVLKESSAGTLFRSTRFSDHQLRTDLLAILTHYVRHGYLRARITDTQIADVGDRVAITITVFEGEPVATRGVRLVAGTGDDPPLEAAGVPVGEIVRDLELEPGKPFDPLRLEEDRRTLLRELADRGHLLAQVRPNVQFAGDEAFVFFRIVPGDVYTVEAVDIEGFRSVRERFVRSDLEIEGGDRYSLDKVTRTQENLLRSGYFSYVRWDTVGVDPSDRTVSLQFRVRERKMQWVELGLGINDRRQLRLTTEWGTRSLFGTGLRFAVRNRAELDLDRGWSELVERNVFEVLFNRQNFMGWHWDLQPNGFWEYVRRDAYQQDIFGAAVTGRRFIGRSRKNQLVLSVENRWVFNDADSAAVAEDPLLARETYQTRVLSARVERDSRDDFFAPVAGSYQRVTLELAGGALGGNNGFRKATASSGQFFPLAPAIVLACRVEGGIANPTAPEDGGDFAREAELIPPEDRYFLGGAYSVRGFGENDLDGRSDPASSLEGGVIELLGNVETRFALGRRISLVTFLDAGNVWQDSGDLTLAGLAPHADPDNVSTTDLRYSYGAGLRFATPVGPIRLDYARKWNIPAATAGIEDSERWHLALGHAF